MEEISLEAYAKINIGLLVGPKRADGYHQVEMVMNSVDLSDRIKLTKRKDGNISMDIDDPYLPTDDSNLAVKAAKEVLKYMKEKKAGVPPDYEGVHISVEKNIPKEAGLAGGSTDAAAVIKGMNRLFCMRLSLEEEMEIASFVGSDVAFCLYEKTALATGRGEIINPIKAFPDCYIVLVKPKEGISTKKAYEALDKDTKKQGPDINALVDLIEVGAPLEDIVRKMGNSFEEFAIKEVPVIKEIKEVLEEKGALKAMMSGSGPTVFGIFTEKKDAEKCAQFLRDESQEMQVFFARRK